MSRSWIIEWFNVEFYVEIWTVWEKYENFRKLFLFKWKLWSLYEKNIKVLLKAFKCFKKWIFEWFDVKIMKILRNVMK